MKGAIDEIERFRDYSRERCAELNSDGAVWDCPADSLDATATPEDVPGVTEAVETMIAKSGVRRCP